MIFITGSTGLIGSHLLYRLTSNGERVKALIRSSKSVDQVEKLLKVYTPNTQELLTLIEWAEGDITDFETLRSHMQGAKTVYHCAATVSMGGVSLRDILDVNVNGTANMVDAALEVGVDGFCHVSSIASLGHPLPNGLVDETCEWGKSKGKTEYAISKFRSEMEVWRGIELGLKATIVNPSVVLGPCRWDKGSGKIFGAISKGMPFYTLGATGYVDVRDVVEGMLQATKRQCWGRRFILNGGNYPHRQVFSLIAKAMGRKPPFIKISPLLSSIAWPLAWLVGMITRGQPILTRSTAQSGHRVTSYSAQRAEEVLNVNFRPIDQAIDNAVRAGCLSK